MIRKLSPEERATINKRTHGEEQMDRKKKNLATELKDLDVDRVDGVDRPATGRAFALYKSAEGTPVKKHKRRFAVSFENIVKGEDAKAFAFPENAKNDVFAPKGLAQVEPEMTLDNPKPTDATRRGPFAKPDSFLHGDDVPAYVGGQDRSKAPVRPLPPYEVRTGAGTMVPDFLNFAEPDEGNPVAEPAMFSPSTPGPIRLGNAYQFVSKAGKPSFADVVFEPTPKNVIEALIVEKHTQKRRNIYRSILVQAIEKCVSERYGADGQLLGYRVKDEDGQVRLFNTLKQACDAVKGMLDQAIDEEDDDNLDENGEPDEAQTHMNAGTQANLDDPTANADPELQRQARARIAQANKNVRLR